MDEFQLTRSSKRMDCSVAGNRKQSRRKFVDCHDGLAAARSESRATRRKLPGVQAITEKRPDAARHRLANAVIEKWIPPGSASGTFRYSHFSTGISSVQSHKTLQINRLGLHSHSRGKPGNDDLCVAATSVSEELSLSPRNEPSASPECAQDSGVHAIRVTGLFAQHQ